jgi:thermitase
MTNNIYDYGNGVDDDGNGMVDEFVGHGTHVSGIIVTEAPGVQIMPIRVLNSDGVGTYWEVAAGIRYAVDHGAKIINMSMSAPRLVPSLADALAYAASHGVIVVGAAGSGPGPNYPAAYSNQPAVIGAGASDPNDGIPWFSGGQASDTDVFAPGVNIYSAYPYNGYGLGSGTSMAAPIVSGEAALLMSRYHQQDRSDGRKLRGTREPEQGAQYRARGRLLRRRLWLAQR